MPKRVTRTRNVTQSNVTYVYIKIVDVTLYIYMCIHMQKKESHAHLIDSKLKLDLQLCSDSHEQKRNELFWWHALQGPRANLFVYIYMYVCMHMCVHAYICVCIHTNIQTHMHAHATGLRKYGVATICRLLKIIGLFCKRVL